MQKSLTICILLPGSGVNPDGPGGLGRLLLLSLSFSGGPQHPVGLEVGLVGVVFGGRKSPGIHVAPEARGAGIRL